MALLKCPECGRDVSSAAHSCPHCGCPVATAPAPKTFIPAAPYQLPEASDSNSFKWIVAVVVGVIAGVIMFALSGDPTKSNNDSLRRARAEIALKASLRDPSSYEYIDSHESDAENGGKCVVIEYRAKNGFGGYGVSSATYFFDADGNIQ